MNNPAPAVYRGIIRHRRRRPVTHGFEYRAFYVLVDIDDLDGLDRSLRLFSVDRFNLFGLDIGDHGPADGSPLRPWAEDGFARAGVPIDEGRILLLTFPRVLGHVFDPISVWFGYGPEGDLRGVIYEVRNTFGHRHSYVVSIDELGMSHHASKRLHVSPFNDMDQSYRFSISEPGERFGLGITVADRDGALFGASMNLERLRFDDRTLARLFITHPLLTLKVVGAIHWQALKIWLKGGRYHRVADPPSEQFTVIESSEVVG